MKYEQDTVTGYWALEAEAGQCCIIGTLHAFDRDDKSF